ncbi:MAG: ABC transporter ATP-binding protein, partial [Oscillospiraceae bacterium]
MLKLEKIVKDYTAGDTTVHALKGIDLQFRESEFVAVLGHSGCGKTTLLNIIGGLDQYTSGDLVINGKSTRDFTDSDWDAYRNHSIGFVFQNYNLIPHQTVLSNVELALTLSGVSKTERRARAKKVLEEVGLGDQLYKKPNQMSGGQMQRVAIARALVNDPDILLADEPTGALDTETSVQVMEILKKISRDRLIIMVTHNPELAETYATRIVRLRDGEIVDDSNPCEEIQEAPAPEGKKQKKPSMSFFTALSLSLNNLMTKKTRTFLTAFAGSIGIIGIALILSLSNGIQTYIDRVQEDTLSSYPITLEAESMDMTAMVSSLMGAHMDGENKEPHDLDAVYSNTILYDLVNSLMSTEAEQNNLAAFKEHLENDETLAEHVSAVQYSYDLNMDIYAQDENGEIFKSDVVELLQNAMSTMYGGDYSSFFSSTYGQAYSNLEVWEEMLPPQEGETDEDGKPVLINDLLTEQYDLVYGSWPQNYDEIVLIVNERNEISDLVIYCLGLGSNEAVLDVLDNVRNGESSETGYNESWTYEELCGKTYKIVLPAEYYQYDSLTGTYSDISATEAGMDFLYNSDDIGTTVHISGIVRPNADAVSSMLSGAIGYTSALTDYLMEKSESISIVQEQKNSPDTDVITGLPFLTDDYFVSDEQKTADITDYIATLSTSEKAGIYTALMSIPADGYVDAVVEQQMGQLTRADIETMVTETYAQQMGVDPETVMNYIAQMDDETLFGYVEEAIAQQVTEQYAQGVQQQMGQMSAEQLAGALDLAMGGDELAQQYAGVSPLTNEQYLWLYDEYMPATVSESSYEDNLALLGVVDPGSPKTISIYATTFADKDAIADAIEAYNDTVDEADQISYTDYVALLMSSITTIINAISYVLIAFVAISLVVSSIMIGIITYISVL